MSGFVLFLAAALAQPAVPTVRAPGAQAIAVASVTVLGAGQAGERVREDQAWRSLRHEGDLVLTCFE
ncbi:MAG TPA: hypothetical protein PKD92_01585 [Novosphingobium sp.]|nr:hypothetical protein [Novosphingobium sp.]